METISAAQLAANQANAALSTGPRTERGKRRSSLKAVRNGLTGQFFVLPSEDRQCYENFIKPMIDSYYPVGPQEQNLAFTIANERWRLQRLYTLENTMFANAIFEQTGDFDVAVETPGPPLAADEGAVLPANQAPVSSPQSLQEVAAATHAAIAQARKLQKEHRAFGTLSLYEQRIFRAIEKVRLELKELQAERKSAVASEAKGPSPVPSPKPPVPSPPPPFPTETPTPDPCHAANGFVYSSAEIQPATPRPGRYHNRRLAAVLAQTFPFAPLEIATLTSETRKILSM